MSPDTNSQQKTEKTNLETALETFIQMVHERRKKEAIEYYWAQEEQTRDYIRKDTEGNMNLKEASLYGI